jgi:dCMP deaminase
MSDKRTDYIGWDDYFMGVSLLAAQRSKDPNTQVGACIVDDQNRILSTGYNGFPHGCSDDVFPWNRDESRGETKYQFVVHAELNAILNCRGINLEGCRIYVALFPCNECAKAIIQCGIKEVVYLSDKYADTMGTRASKRMFAAAGVKMTKLSPTRASVLIDFDENKV